MKCSIHGDNCPGDDGGFFMDGNHPDDMFGVWEMRQMEGIVVRVIQQKGFGFIRGTDSREYFFHRDDLQGFFDDLVKEIELGRTIKVTFESVPSEKGLRAGKVVRV